MKTRLLINLSTILAIATIACSSPKHALKQENFDGAITKAIRKIAKSNERLKIKHIETLRFAFDEANHRNLISIKALKKSKRPENWITINRLYNKIIARQNRVLPYARQAAFYGYDLEDLLIDYTNEEYASRQKAADYLYTKANDAMIYGRQGDKLAARDAFKYLTQLNDLFENYQDKNELLDEALHLGTDHILVSVDNRSGALIPRRLKHRIMDFEVERLNDLFHIYYTRDNADQPYDYAIHINITDLRISPESQNINTYEESKEISDGWDYVLDANGNVMKDTSGNDIKVERFKTVRATVEEIRQFKALALSGNVELKDLSGNRILRSAPIRAEALFENYAGTYYGDREALSTSARQILGNRPIPFPSDELLLEDAVDLIRPVVLDKIERLKIS